MTVQPLPPGHMRPSPITACSICDKWGHHHTDCTAGLSPAAVVTDTTGSQQ